MSKKACLNILLSANTDDPISLSALSSVSQLCKDHHLKVLAEIQGNPYLELETKAINCERDNELEAFSLWFKSLPLKLSSYKSIGDKVSLTQIQKYLLQFLQALYSQIIALLKKNKTSKTTEFLAILASFSHQKYRLPDEERQRCKVRYYIL